MKKEYIMVSRPWGVYLGSCLGLGFWSKLEAAGQMHACTFESESQARDIMSRWDTPPENDLSFLEVCIPENEQWASMEECVKAGVEPWIP